MRLIPKRKIQGSEELMNSLALGETATKLPLDDTAVDGRTQEGITSNWAYDHNAKTTGTHGVTGTIVGTEDLDDIAWAEPTRALDTIYTNSTKIRIVSVSCYATSANSYYRFDAYCDNTDGATTIVGKAGGKTDSGSAPIASITFVVPPSYKYQVVTAGDNETLTEWHEWDLL